MFRDSVIRGMLFFVLGLPGVLCGSVVEKLQVNFIGMYLEDALAIHTLDLNDPDPKASPAKKYCHVIYYDYCGKKETFKACVSDLCEYFYASIKPIVGVDIEDRYAESFLKN